MNGIVIHARDTVATVTERVPAGTTVPLTNGAEVEAVTDIPARHKVALVTHQVGERVIKYGAEIGEVVNPIAPGEHVHSHNLVTVRGRRGDA